MRLLCIAFLMTAGPASAQDTIRGVDSINQAVVTGNTARVPNCPNWHSGSRNSVAETDANFGCAVNSNIAAMIVDPQDLLHGRTDPLTGRDAETAVRTVRANKPGAAAPAAPKGPGQ